MATLTVYGGFEPTGVVANLDSLNLVFDNCPYKMADISKAQVQSKDFVQTDGSINTKVSIHFFLKKGGWFPISLDKMSLLKVGDEVALNSVRIKELAKGDQIILTANGKKA